MFQGRYADQMLKLLFSLSTHVFLAIFSYTVGLLGGLLMEMLCSLSGTGRSMEDYSYAYFLVLCSFFHY